MTAIDTVGTLSVEVDVSGDLAGVFIHTLIMGNWLDNKSITGFMTREGP